MFDYCLYVGNEVCNDQLSSIICLEAKSLYMVYIVRFPNKKKEDNFLQQTSLQSFLMTKDRPKNM